MSAAQVNTQQHHALKQTDQVVHSWGHASTKKLKYVALGELLTLCYVCFRTCRWREWLCAYLPSCISSPGVRSPKHCKNCHSVGVEAAPGAAIIAYCHL